MHINAAMLALVRVTACVAPTKFEKPLLERILLAAATLGLAELARILDCLGEDDLHDQEIKEKGAPSPTLVTNH
jgi:hypothetical protein